MSLSTATINATLVELVGAESAARLASSADQKQLAILVGGAKSGRKELLPAIKERLLSMLPQSPIAGDDELAALLSAPLPTAPKQRKVATAKPTAAPRKAGGLIRKSPVVRSASKNGTIYHDWKGQPPISSETSNALPWLTSAAIDTSGKLWLNVGFARKSIGATIEDWREILRNADELLADLESFHSEIA